MSMNQALVTVAMLAWPTVGVAGELGDAIVDARHVGRAGTTTVSGDSGHALVSNPAGMVRRSESRLLLGIGITESDLRYVSERTDSPSITDRAPQATLPFLAYHHGFDDGRIVVGVLLRSGGSASSLPKPAFGQPAEDVERLFPHRYGGLQVESTWRQLATGAAIRLGDSWAVGLSAGVRQISHLEERHVWAGFDGRDPLLGAERDLLLRIRARDSAALSGSVGVLYAPLWAPLEFAAAVEGVRGATFESSEVFLDRTSAAQHPMPIGASPTATLETPHRVTSRAGARYLGERVLLEAGVEYARTTEESQEWRLEGLEVVDESSATGALQSMPALASERSRLAVRAAADVEVVSGFLWLTAGYAWHSPRTALHRRVPVHAKLGGHRGAVGLLATHEEYSLSVGYARQFARTRTSLPDSSPRVPNPFDAGTGPAAAGRYTASHDHLGFSLEVIF